MTTYLEAVGLSKSYGTGGWLGSKEHKAVDSVDLVIKRGEIMGLIGESGSGKSTLGRMLCKLTKPTEGSIIVNGEDITGYTQKQMRTVYRRMQMIFQDNTSSLNPRKPIGEQIIVPMLRLGTASSRKEAVYEAQRLLERVGLKSEHFSRYPHEFSGGQRQRIGIARALAVQAEFLILDEPTSALDVSIQAQILNLLLDLREEFGLTYLFIGHNLAVIEFFCDRVAVMDKGRLVEMLPSDQLFQSAEHPATQKLINAVLPVHEGAYDTKPLVYS
ncbi:ATP-binding cassette domain-containing protein [Paenibacillus sp. NPDC058071]|uniref:ATP-binding cassette domain-containing protein n=1 Tax=Paenibacillus sp. NPDC058071 TaxID=3346326 RepID=UPI0036D7F533